jgi:hypothetical protein
MATAMLLFPDICKTLVRRERPVAAMDCSECCIPSSVDTVVLYNSLAHIQLFKMNLVDHGTFGKPLSNSIYAAIAPVEWRGENMLTSERVRSIAEGLGETIVVTR